MPIAQQRLTAVCWRTSPLFSRSIRPFISRASLKPCSRKQDSSQKARAQSTGFCFCCLILGCPGIRLRVGLQKLLDAVDLRLTETKCSRGENAIDLIGPPGANNGCCNGGKAESPSDRDHPGLNVVRFADLPQPFHKLQ